MLFSSQVLAKRLLHKSHLKSRGGRPGTLLQGQRWHHRTYGGTQVAKATRCGGLPIVAVRVPPPHAVTRPRASPPPGPLRRWLLASRLGLTILTPSAEPMAGIARDSFTRVTRCQQPREPITVLRRRVGSPHKPITAKEAGLALLAPPPTRRDRFRGCSTWPGPGDRGPQFLRGRPGEGSGKEAGRSGSGSGWLRAAAVWC